MNKKIIKGPNGLSLVLDKDQVVKDDPGAGTPAMVVKKDWRGVELDSGTFWCAIGEAELSNNGTRLDDSEMEWLNGLAETVNEFLYQD